MGRMLLAALAPAVVTIVFAARGWLNIDHLVMLGGLVLLTFAPAYLFADFVHSLFVPRAEEEAPSDSRAA